MQKGLIEPVHAPAHTATKWATPELPIVKAEL